MPNWTVCRILDFKQVSREGLKENEEHLTGYWRKEEPHSVLTESWTTVTRSNVEVTNTLHALDDLAKISTQTGENATETLLRVTYERAEIS